MILRCCPGAGPVISLLNGVTHRLHPSRLIAGSAALDATIFLNALMGAAAKSLRGAGSDLTSGSPSPSWSHCARAA
jgi:hypothetical protein